jgi:hypothetical protein
MCVPLSKPCWEAEGDGKQLVTMSPLAGKKERVLFIAALLNGD